MNQEEFMINGVQTVIVRLHTKRKAVADCDQTIAVQQLLWRLDSQAALLEEYVKSRALEEAMRDEANWQRDDWQESGWSHNWQRDDWQDKDVVQVRQRLGLLTVKVKAGVAGSESDH